MRFLSVLLTFLSFGEALLANFDTIRFKSPLRAATPDSSIASIETDKKESTSFDLFEMERSKFQQDSAVDFWRTFKSKGNDENMRLIRQFLLDKLADSSPLARAYWASFGLRTGFFGLVALTTNVIADRQNGDGTSMLNSMDLSFRALELCKAYEQEFELVQQGKLKYPWDYLVRSHQNSLSFQFNHKQASPFFVLRESLNLAQEAPAILKRVSQFQGRPTGTVWMDSPARTHQQSSSIKYPQYYLNDFHYQTDGWLSSRSADLYEMSSETIFIGSQDLMQRQSILPLREYFGTNINGGPSSILEVACGTGRLSTFVRDTFPAAKVTLTDLSPFYLEKAKANDDYWRDYRGKDAMEEETGIRKTPKPVRIVQANAEDLPFPDDSFTAVTCTYLFHELPGPARRRAAAEMARVVQPGGMVVWSDSMQQGERQAFPSIEAFGRFNEPHYGGYVRSDIVTLFEEHGLVPHRKYFNSRTKTLSFIKKVE